MTLMNVLGGVQRLTIGLLGDYVGEVCLEAKQRSLYVIRDVLDARQAAVEPDDQRDGLSRATAN